MAAVIGILALLPIVKLADVQVGDASTLRAVGANQRTVDEPIPALRGSIVDRNGVELAVSVPRTTVALSRKALTSADITTDDELEQLAVELAGMLGLDEPTVVAEILGATPDDDDVVLGEDVDPQKAEAARQELADRNLPGVLGIRSRSEREYPAGSSGLPVIGTLGPDGPAEMAGVEKAYDDTLRGQDGARTVERGRDGATIVGSEHVRSEPRPGSDVEVTLDRTLQAEAERFLIRGAENAGAHQGVALIGRPTTGELLAVAGVERDEDSGDVELSSLPLAFTNAYQAGSVFKLVTAAASYEAGVVNRTREFTVPSRIKIEDWDFTDAHDHETRQMTVDEIVAESSNVGTIQMALFLGSDRLYKALQDFGFGRTTGVGHPAESAGLLPSSDGWARSDLAAASIGTFQTTTAVQLWSAYNVIANRGLYVPPRLVAATIAPDGTRTEVPAPDTHRVVSAASATEVDRALRKVVQEGTGKQWNLPGFPVAAKTGTSRIPSPEKVDPEDDYIWVDGRYHYVTTFTGYLPADRPQVSITVLLYDTNPDLSGSTSAGPVFSDLARMSIRELAIAPTEDPTAPTVGADGTEAGEGTADAAVVQTATGPVAVSGDARDGRIRAVPATSTAGATDRSASGTSASPASTSSSRTSTTMAGSTGRSTGGAGTG